METEDKFHAFFKQNQTHVPEHEPREGHFERMQQKLAFANETRKGRTINMSAWLAAASVLVLLGLAIGYTYLVPESTANHQATAQDSISTNKALPTEKTEYADVELYYNIQINQKLRSLESNLQQDSTSLEELIAALDGLEQQYQQLKKEIQMGVSNEQITKRMIQNYQLRLELLNRVSGQLQKNLKTKNHEIKNS